MIKTCLIKLDLVLDFNNLVLAIIKEIDPTIDTGISLTYFQPILIYSKIQLSILRTMSY